MRKKLYLFLIANYYYKAIMTAKKHMTETIPTEFAQSVSQTSKIMTSKKHMTETIPTEFAQSVRLQR